MTAPKIVLISGSPSATSRSQRLLSGIEKELQTLGFVSRPYAVRDFDAQALLLGNSKNAQIQTFLEDVKSAAGVVVSTPVYKATFAGALKVLLDVIPPDALIGKAALGVATARISEQLGATAIALAAVFKFFQIATVVPALTLLDEAVFVDADSTAFTPEVDRLLAERARSLSQALR